MHAVGGGEGAIVVEVKTGSSSERRGSAVGSCESFWALMDPSRHIRCWSAKTSSVLSCSSLRGSRIWRCGLVIIARRIDDRDDETLRPHEMNRNGANFGMLITSNIVLASEELGGVMDV